MVKLYCKALAEETTLYNSAKGGPLRTEICFSPERSSKVLKISKNDRLDALIVLLRDDQF